MASTRRQDAGNRRNSGPREMKENTISADEALVESRRWIEAVTSKSFKSADFRASLADGMLLCELVEKVGDLNVGRLNRLPTAYAGIDNLTVFLGACESLGLTRDQLFDVTDLQEVPHRRGDGVGSRAKESHKRLRNVAKTIYWLAKAAENRRNFQGPYLDEKCFINLVADAYKAVRAKSPTFGNDSRCLEQFNGESIMKEQDKLFDGVDYRSRQEQLERQHNIDREEEPYEPRLPRRASTGSSLKEKEKAWAEAQRKRYTEQFRPVTIATKTEVNVKDKRQLFQELGQRAEEEASVLQGNRPRQRRTSAGSIESKTSRAMPLPARDVNLNEKRRRFEELDREASIDSEVLSGKVRRTRPKSYHGGDRGPVNVVSLGPRKSDVQLREKQQKFEKLQRQATLESAVLEGKVRQPAGSGMSREDGRPPPQGATKDMRLRDKQEKFEKLDRQAEIEKAVIHGELRMVAPLDDTSDHKKQSRAAVVREADVNLRGKQAKFEHLDRQASQENNDLQLDEDIVDAKQTDSAVLKGSVRIRPGMRTRDSTDSKRPVTIPRGEDVQFKEKHRKFEILDWKAEQESSVLNKNRRKSSGKEIRSFQPLSTASRPTVNQFGQTKPIGYENVPDALITGSLTRRTPYRVNTARPKSNIYEYQHQIEENDETDQFKSGQIHRPVSDNELTTNEAISAPPPPPRQSSLHRRSAPLRPTFHREDNHKRSERPAVPFEPAVEEESFQQASTVPVESTQSSGVDVRSLTYRDFVVPPSKGALEKREAGAEITEKQRRESSEDTKKVPRYVQQKHKVHDMARQFTMHAQSPKERAPPPRQALVDRAELERFERSTKAKSWYTLEDDRPLDYGLLGSYNTSRPRRRSEGHRDQEPQRDDESIGRPEAKIISRSLPGNLHRGPSPDDEVFMDPQPQEQSLVECFPGSEDYPQSIKDVPGNRSESEQSNRRSELLDEFTNHVKGPTRLDTRVDQHLYDETPPDRGVSGHISPRYEEPVQMAVYPLEMRAQPTFVEPSETQRMTYPARSHAQPDFISPNETQRYPKYGPETEARGAGREGAEHLWQTPYYPLKDHELETDIRSVHMDLVHSNPDVLPYEDSHRRTMHEDAEHKRTRREYPEDPNTVVRSAPKHQNTSIVVQCVARSTARAKPQRVSVRAIPHTAVVYKPASKTVTASAPRQEQPGDTWVSYSDNSTPDTQDAIQAAVQKTVQRATDIDAAINQKDTDIVRDSLVSPVMVDDTEYVKRAKPQTIAVVGQIDIKRFDLDEQIERREDEHIRSRYSHPKDGRPPLEDWASTTDRQEADDAHDRVFLDYRKQALPPKEPYLEEEPLIVSSSHHPDRTLPGWDFRLDLLDNEEPHERCNGEPSAVEFGRHNQEHKNPSYQQSVYPQDRTRHARPATRPDYYTDSHSGNAQLNSYNPSYRQQDLEYDSSYKNPKHFPDEERISSYTTPEVMAEPAAEPAAEPPYEKPHEVPRAQTFGLHMSHETDRLYWTDRPNETDRPCGTDRPYETDRPYGNDKSLIITQQHTERGPGSDMSHETARPYGIDRPRGTVSESSDDSFASPIKYRKEFVTPPHGQGYDYRDTPDKFRAEHLRSPEYRAKLRKELKEKNQKQREGTEYLLQQWRASQGSEEDDVFNVETEGQQPVGDEPQFDGELPEHGKAQAERARQELIPREVSHHHAEIQPETTGSKYREEQPVRHHRDYSHSRHVHREDRETDPRDAYSAEYRDPTENQHREAPGQWEEDMYRLPNGRQVKPDKLVKLVKAEEKYWKKKLEKKKRRTSGEIIENGYHAYQAEPTSDEPETFGFNNNGIDTLEKNRRLADIDKLRDVPFEDPGKEERIRKLKAEEEFMAQEAERLMRAKIEQAERPPVDANVIISQRPHGSYVDDPGTIPAEQALDYALNDHNVESVPSNAETTSLIGYNIYESFIHGKGNRVICCCCGRAIERAMSMYMVELDKYWHMKCFRCAMCNKMFNSPESQTGMRITADILHCESCFVSEDGGCTEV